MKKSEVILSWLKTAFFKVGNHFAVKFVTKLLARIGLGLSGPVGWVASFLIEKVLKKAWYWVAVGYHKITEYYQTKKELKKYKETINKPGATPEEIADAADDFITS